MSKYVARWETVKVDVEKGIGWITLNRPDNLNAVNDALLSGNIEVAGAGVGPLLTIWDRTKGRQNVKGVASLGNFPWSIELLLEEYELHKAGKKRLAEIVVGFNDLIEEEPAADLPDPVLIRGYGRKVEDLLPVMGQAELHCGPR